MNTIYCILDTIFPFEWLSPRFMKNAFLAVLLAAPLFGTLGTFVVSSKMAFFSDAIGHSVLTGIAIGVLLGIDDPVIAMVAFSVVLGIAIITVKTRDTASIDTVIGIFSSTASALGIVLLSRGGGFAKYSKFLIGDILSIVPSEIGMLGIANLVLILLWVLFFNVMLMTSVHSGLAGSRGIRTFFIEQLFAIGVAVVVTISIRWTGLLVINSLLILPASAARNISRNSAGYLFIAIILSIFASIVGLVASFYWGTATGATIVLFSAILYVATLLFKNNRWNTRQ